jgi:hypothetical protein
VQLLGKALQIDETALRKRQYVGAQLRGLHAPRQPLEQWRAEEFLELAHEFRSAWLREMNGLGGAVKIAVLPQRNQKGELPEPEPSNEMRERWHFA